jgi:hypothetical protein
MNTQKISLNIPVEILDRINGLAEKAEIDRTRLMVNMLDECSKTLAATSKVGIYQFSILMRDFGEKMSEWAKKIKAKKVEPL